jgi:hypothetical protein
VNRDSFAVAIQRYCTQLNGSVIGWGETQHHRHQRDPRCGMLHLVWLAVDVVYDQEHALAVRRDVASALGLVVVPLPDYDHVAAAHFSPIQ